MVVNEIEPVAPTSVDGAVRPPNPFRSGRKSQWSVAWKMPRSVFDGLPTHWIRNAIDEVVYQPSEDSNTELKRYRADDLDVTYEIPLQQASWLRQHYGRDLRVASYLGTYFYGFVAFAALGLVVLAMLRVMQIRWTRTWAEKGGRARVTSHR